MALELTRKAARRRFAVLALCASLPLAAMPLVSRGQSQLPDFGDPASTTLSPADEREIGALLMRQIRAYMPVIDDPEVENYIQPLGYNLLANGTQGSTGTPRTQNETSRP